MRAIEYTYLRFEQDGMLDEKPVWKVVNIMYPDAIIGYVKYDIFIHEYCYYALNPHYSPGEIILSQTNICDICKFLMKISWTLN